MTSVGGAGRTGSAGCIDPSAITPGDLMAHADGDAPASIAAHVAQCSSCAAEAGALRRDSRRLARALYRFDCPSPQTLGEYHLDLLSPEERTEIAAHALECPHCAAELQTLRTFLGGPLMDPLMEPDPAAQSAAGPMERLRRVVATLLSPPATPAYAGLRGIVDDAVKTYQAGDLTLTMSAMPAARHGRVSLMGLLVSADTDLAQFSGAEARLVAPDGAAHATRIDELGNFDFDDLVPGTYRLELELSDQIVLVENIVV